VSRADPCPGRENQPPGDACRLTFLESGLDKTPSQNAEKSPGKKKSNRKKEKSQLEKRLKKVNLREKKKSACFFQNDTV